MLASSIVAHSSHADILRQDREPIKIEQLLSASYIFAASRHGIAKIIGLVGTFARTEQLSASNCVFSAIIAEKDIVTLPTALRLDWVDP
jgi:hypothetical protein